jgi:hypothetical protein
MTTFKYTGPEQQALIRDPSGILPDILVKKGDTFTTEEKRIVDLVKDLPMYEEQKNEPKLKNGKI